ncbi:DUF6286 domain-containing protein [Streptomyces sp. NPDC001514]
MAPPDRTRGDPGPPAAQAPAPNAIADDGRTQRSHRPWSARRVPAAVVALLTFCAAGTALYDVVAVRVGREAGAWRKHLADEFATRPLDDVWMLTGAAVATVAGLWLLTLALTPGLRHQLPLRAPNACAPLRVSLDRDGAAVLLRDAAMRVPGVARARVRVRRHRVKARADVRFRESSQVQEDLYALLREECDRLALSRPPRLVVRVRRSTRSLMPVRS